MKLFITKTTKNKHTPGRLKLALKHLLAAMNSNIPSRIHSRSIQAISNEQTELIEQLDEYNDPESATDDVATDCCICLSSLSPSQCLFLAPCSHCFHYKVRPELIILNL